MSVDIYRTRRGYNYRCTYYKRDESGRNDNNQLKYKNSPDGVFYAKLVAEKGKETQDLANAWHTHYETLTLETQDIVNLEKDDHVIMDGKTWIVTSVRESINQKNSEYSIRTSRKTTIGIQRES